MAYASLTGFDWIIGCGGYYGAGYYKANAEGTGSTEQGAFFQVSGPAGYYIYMAQTTTGGYIYYNKGYKSTVNTYITADAISGTNNYITYQVVLYSENEPSITVGNQYASYVKSVNVYRYGAQITCQGMPADVYVTSGSVNLSTFGIVPDGTITGYSKYDSGSNALTSYVTTLSSTNGPTWNAAGGTMTSTSHGSYGRLNAIVSTSTSKTIYYYRGSSTRYSVSGTIGEVDYGYGGIGKYYTTTGAVTATEPSHVCASDSSYDQFQGWTTSSSRYAYADYDTIAEALEDGATTVYGIFYRSGSSDGGATKYYYRGSATRYTVSFETTKNSGFIYGTGSVYGGGESYTLGSMTTTCASDSSYTFQGWATSSTTQNVAYTDAKTAYTNGATTLYGIFKKAGSSSDSSVYYYRGGPTKYSTTKTTTTGDSYYYGTGSKTTPSTTTSFGSVTTACEVTGWTFLGFSSSASVTSGSSTANELFSNNYTTIYGTYSKSESMTYYPQNGNSSSSVSVTNNRYGINAVTNNIPAEPSITNGSAKLLGWATTADSTSYTTWNTLWNNGTRTVYAIWEEEESGNIYVGVNGVWIKANVYVGVNGVWKQSTTKIGASGIWKG